MKISQTKLVLITVLAAGLLGQEARATGGFENAAAASVALIKAAHDEIEADKNTGSTQTACDIYLEGVLNRANLPIGHFLANDLDKSVSAHLPLWKVVEFTTDHPGEDQAALLSFLNSAPDGTAFLAQWSREGRSGHVALVEKNGLNQYTIDQAQQGLSLPYSKKTSVRELLYPKGQWGDRSHLRLFYE